MRYTNEEKQVIVKEYQCNGNIKNITAKYNISKSTLYNWISLFTERKSYNAKVYTYYEYYKTKKALEQRMLEIEVAKKFIELLDINISEKQKLVDKYFGVYPVKTMCKLIGLNYATFYNYHFRKIVNGAYAKHEEMLTNEIRRVYQESGERFGANKIYQKLKAQEVSCSLATIVTICKKINIVNKRIRKRKSIGMRPIGFTKFNLLKQDFNQKAPNLFWVSDVTEYKIATTRIYICVIMDLFSRVVVSYRVSLRNNTSLTVNSFKDAFESRQRPVGLSFHSDQGVNYTSHEFKNLLITLKVRQSFSKRGTPYDNAVIESFFSNLKQDELNHREFVFLEDFEEVLKEYIGYYNDYRPHRALGYKTPRQVENLYIKEKNIG